MNEHVNRQVDDILKNSEAELSSFEKIIRKPFNSNFADGVSKIFDAIFEPKSFTLALIVSLVVFYGFFFIALLTNSSVNYSILLFSTIILYIVLRIIKFTKTKIR